MKLFIDANLLVSVVNKEYPLFTYSARILSLASSPRKYQLCTTPLCLAIAFYFAEKKHGSAVAKKKIAELAKHLYIIPCGAAEVEAAINNIKAYDFEDGLQYYSAFNFGCNVIITNDLEDFYYADIEVISPKAFMERLLKPYQ